MLQVNYRCVDIDDVMLNTIGGIFGFLCGLFWDSAVADNF